MDDEIPADEREALVQIASGAVITSGGISIQRVLMTTLEFVLVRGLGPALYGVYAFAWRIAQLLFRLVNFGAIHSLQRFIPAHSDDPDRQRRIAGLAYGTTAVVGAALAIGLIALANRINDATVIHTSFTPTLQLFAVLIALVGIVQVHAGLLRSVGSAKGSVTFNQVLRPAVRLLGALLAVALGYSVVGVAGTFVAGIGLLAIVGFPATSRRTGIRPTLLGSRREMRNYYNHSVPLALSSLGTIFHNRIDVILIGLILTAEAAGIYNVALVLIAITWIPLASFNQLLPPIAADLYASGNAETLEAVYTSVTRLVVTFVLPLVSIQFVFGRDLLAIFGPTYVDGYLPLVVYLVGVVVGSAVGATGWLLIVTDHQYIRLLFDWLLAGANVVLTYVLVLEFGLVGAALGTALAISAQNLIQAVLLRHLEGLWPFDVTFYKPIVAATVMSGVMLSVRAGIDGPISIVVGSVVGFAVFTGVLYTLGVNPRDRLVVRELGARYRDKLEALVS